MKRQILVIDDEAALRHMLRLVLERDGYAITEAASGREGLDRLGAAEYDFILCDIRMPELDGLAFLGEKVRLGHGGTVIMMSAYGTIDTAVECMKQGAYDYVSKPFRPDEILLTVRKAEERLQLRQENVRLREDLQRSGRPQGTAAIVHRSAVMTGLLDTLRKAAATSVPVLVLGETGTGKELVARALHAESPRRDRPFLAVNCSAIPAGLLESELFGHVRGAFTGADRDRTGLFGAAEGGTLLLDEIGDLPLELQPKLLRVLQEGEVRRVGDSRAQPVDVRVVAATAVDLRQAVAQGRFREDLFYRLAVVTLELPPLRRRPEDLLPLVEALLPRLAARFGRPVPTLTAAALQALERHPWPGNVRELVNVLEKTLVLCREETVDAGDILIGATPLTNSDPGELSLKKATEELERDYIRRALAATGGNRTQAARLLEISLRNLLYKLKEYGE
ncbi:MAG: sigma-54-dependent Fis family transcriptional regulator [Deltaproteobacteria bacterium]|nr:MAG: sigma-54-dependent Fis family transcriptional regulator [Deltaproteobacteria bacterium]